MSGLNTEGQTSDPAGNQQDAGKLDEGEFTDENPSGVQTDAEWREGMETRVDEGFSRIERMLNTSRVNQDQRQTQAPVEEETFDDEEPITASKINKIIKNAMATGAAQSRDLTERSQWDQKAKNDFPINDPKFQREFAKGFEDFISSGGNRDHPRCVYHVAKQTAQRLGVKRNQTQTERGQTTDNQEQLSAEAPNRSASIGRGVNIQQKKGELDKTSNSQLALYNMRGTKSKEQVEVFTQKLLMAQAKRQRREHA